MKRILFLFILGVTTLLSSCINGDDESSPTLPGVYIYANVKFTNDLAVDPINVAVRLNILLMEAEGDPSNFDSAVVTISDNDYNVKDELFGSNVDIEETSTGVFAVTYSDSYNESYNLLRRGTFIIDTKNYSSLYEDGSVWDISMGQSDSENDYRPYMVSYSSSIDYYYGDNSTYTIYGSSYFELLAEGCAYPISSQADDDSDNGEWSVSMTIGFYDNTDAQFGLEDILNSTKDITLNFNNYGSLVTSPSYSSYMKGTNAVYRASLLPNDFIDGEIEAYDSASNASDPSTYPTSVTVVTRIFDEDSETVGNYVYYNGVTEQW